MAYIYHIYSTEDANTVYIGQCLDDAVLTTPVYENTSMSGTRPLQHFSGLYNNRTENTNWQQWIKKHPLSTMKIIVFQGPYYGLDQLTLDSFFDVWQPRNIPSHWTFNYDEISHFETKDVKNKSSWEHLVTTNILDAAEILHIYAAKKSGKTLLNQSMGGQSYFVGKNSAMTLNSTMSIEQMMQVFNSSPAMLDKLQRQFDKELTQIWTKHTLQKNYKINTTFQLTTGMSFQDALIAATKSIMTKEITSKKRKKVSTALDMTSFKNELNKILKCFLTDSFPLILKNLRYHVHGQAEIHISPLLKNLYSQTKSAFSQVKTHNIIDVMVNILSKKSFWTEYLKNSKQAGTTLQEEIQSHVNQIVQDLIKSFQNQHISVNNFVNVQPIVPTKNAWVFLNISYQSLGNFWSTHEYLRSLKKMSYFYFIKHIAAEALKNDSGISFPRHVTYDSDYYCIASGFRWSMAIKSLLKSKGLHFMQSSFLDDYCAQMLTIYAQNQPASTPMKEKMSLKKVPGQSQVFKLGVFDIPGFERISLKNLNPRSDVNTWDDVQIQWHYVPAYIFSDETYTRMEDWIDAKIDDIEFY